ncbi:hypothetical protein SLS56_002732 [Neofusicoccum ribis]|uniref:Uncharacterized protein n=1 Tax=Neofusicoccum ribis TaxID=45134 RepID=A0ABR3T2U9_9PEZI
MAFYFDDLLSAGDAEQALRYKFSHVDIRPGSARSDYTTGSSKNSTTPLRKESARNKLIKYNARYSTPLACAAWPCKASRLSVVEPRYHYQYQYHRQGYSYLDL